MVRFKLCIERAVMKRVLLLLSYLVICLNLALAGNKEFPSTFWKIINSENKPNVDFAIATKNDKILVVGKKSFGEKTSMWIMKMDQDGNQIWSKTFGYKDRQDRLYSVIETQDGNFLISSTFLFKINQDGQQIWKKEVSGGTIKETHDGGFVILRKTSFTKIDQEGNVVWKQSFQGGEYGHNLNSIAEYEDGSFCLVGFKATKVASNIQSHVWFLRVDPGGNKMWEKLIGDISPHAEMIQVDDGYILLSEKEKPKSGHWINYDAWVTKVDNVGNILWEKSFGGKRWDSPKAMIALKNGSIIITGKMEEESRYDSDLWLFKIDSGGNLLWEWSFGGRDSEYGNAVIATKDGGICVLGGIYSSRGNDAGMLIIKTDENGRIYKTNIRGKVEQKNYHQAPTGQKIYH